MPPLPSEVWKHFRKSADKSTASCLLCSATIQLHGGTSNLRSHIKFKHLSVDNNKASPDVAKQQTLHQVFGPRPSSSEAINQALANFVVQAYVPMKIVEHERFRHLMQLLNPQYEVPSRTTVRARIDLQYDDAKKSLLSSLQGSTSVALTTDSWTSNATEAYLTVTVHYIKEDWSMESRILMTRAMPERHTGENLAIRLKDCVDEFGLKGRVVACVHDNARNMDLASRLCPDWQDLPCFAHTLQLCVKPVMDIPSVADVMSRARKIVGHFRHSTTMIAELRSRRVVMQLPDHDLIQDVPTRWNSSQMMLQRLVEQRRVVTDILLNPRLTGKRDRGLLLTDAEWEIAGDVASALQDLTEATNNMCSDTHVSSSEIL